MQPDTLAEPDQTQPLSNHGRVVWLYGLSFGALAAVASITYLLISAFYEADFLVHGPRPISVSGGVDFRPIREHAYFFFAGTILPVACIILVCVFVGAYFAARASRRFAIGMGAALIVCVLSIVLYAIASALAAQYIVEPAIGDDFLTARSLAVSIVVGLALLILTGIVSRSASALGAFGQRTSVPEASQA